MHWNVHPSNAGVDAQYLTDHNGQILARVRGDNNGKGPNGVTRIFAKPVDLKVAQEGDPTGMNRYHFTGSIGDEMSVVEGTAVAIRQVNGYDPNGPIKATAQATQKKDVVKVRLSNGQVRFRNIVTGKFVLAT